jgi:hypothetical protein
MQLQLVAVQFLLFVQYCTRHSRYSIGLPELTVQNAIMHVKATNKDEDAIL